MYFVVNVILIKKFIFWVESCLQSGLLEMYAYLGIVKG